jgi:hypothetical protein
MKIAPRPTGLASTIKVESLFGLKYDMVLSSVMCFFNVSGAVWCADVHCQVAFDLVSWRRDSVHGWLVVSTYSRVEG